MEESIVERVLLVIKDYGLTASEFADKIDVQRSSMSHLVSGRNKPSLDFIQKVLSNFSDINPTWLIMGTGPMKQLDLFDIKGDVAPIQPIPVEKFRVESPVAIQENPKPSIQESESTTPFTEDKKVIYAQSAPTAAALTEPPHIHIEEPVIQHFVTASVIAQPVIAPAASTTPVQPLGVPATNQEHPTPSPKVNPVLAEAEKSVQNDKKVVKIVFFYSDNTFETFNPH